MAVPQKDVFLAILPKPERKWAFSSLYFWYFVPLNVHSQFDCFVNLPNTKALDNIDRKILAEIQREGRISIIDLSERVSISKSPCLQRLRRLERDGYIRGYHADLDPHKIDATCLVFIQVKLENTSRKTLEDFNAAVKDIPEIQECHMMSGGFDYLLKVRTQNMAAYRDLLGDVISSLPGVGQTATFRVMEEVKDTSALSIKIE